MRPFLPPERAAGSPLGGPSTSEEPVGRKIRPASRVRPRVTNQGWRVAAFASAAVTGALLAGVPVLATSSCRTTAGGAPACTSSRQSLLSSEGSGVLLVLAVPAGVALVPVLLRSRRASLAAAAALTLLAFLGLASVGIFLVPTVVLAWVAARTTPVAPAA